MIKIAVIGLGHPHIFSMISQLLAEPEFNIVALCDPREPINVKRAMEMVPNAKCFENEEEVYAQCDFDAVLSSAANGYKGDIAIRALQNDKSIVFDKPLVTRKSDLEKIKSLLIEKPYLSANLWLTCRYAKGYYTVKEMINQGLIGVCCKIKIPKSCKLKFHSIAIGNSIVLQKSIAGITPKIYPCI
jgi:scyllo-inositol 2-dehydrogenase (NADP+)